MADAKKAQAAPRKKDAAFAPAEPKQAAAAPTLPGIEFVDRLLQTAIREGLQGLK